MIKLKQIDLAGASTTTAVTDGLALTGTEAAELIAGVDGTNHAQFIATDTAGHVLVADGGGSLTVDGTVAISGTVPVSDGGGSITIDGSVSVSNFPATQPISAAALPLPSGAATETTLGTRLTEATFTTRTPTVGQKTSAASSPVVIASDQSAVPVSAASLPLPTGASTEATLATRLTESTFTTRTPLVGQKTSAASSPVVLASDQSAVPVSAASLPLPSGAATETTLASRLTESMFTTRTPTVGQKTAAGSSPVVLASDQGALTVSDGGGSITVDTDQLPATLVGGRLNTNLGSWFGSTTPTIGQKPMTGSLPVVLASDQSTLPIEGTGTAGTPAGGVVTVQGATSGTPLAVSAASLPLPTGASTETTLATLLTESTFTGRTPTVGQKTSAGSSPVVLASDQSALSVSDGGGSITIDGSVSVSNFPATQPISAASLPLPTGAATETTLASLLTESTFTGRINTQGQKAAAASTPVVLASDQTSIPVTDNGGSLTVDGSVTANIGTTNGLALDATLTGGTQQSKITDGTNVATVKAASTAAAAADKALVVAISPNNTIPISAASLPLPTGASTETTLGTRLAESTFTGRINTQGQKTSAASTPVVLASDQSAISVSGTVTANVGTTNGLALDATLTGGTAKAIARGGAKGSTTAADVTSTASGSNHQPLDVAIYDASGNQVTSFGGGTQFADGAARSTATGTLMMVDDGTNIQSASGDTSGRLNTLSRVTDGTNVAAVKASTTAPVVTDPALVVAISPNTAALSVTASTNPTGTLSNVTASVTSVTLLASNASRKGAMLVNDSASTVYVKFGTTASTTSFTILMAANSYYEVPFSYSGILTGIWTSATGTARVTEIT